MLPSELPRTVFKLSVVLVALNRFARPDVDSFVFTVTIRIHEHVLVGDDRLCVMVEFLSDPNFNRMCLEFYLLSPREATRRRRSGIKCVAL